MMKRKLEWLKFFENEISNEDDEQLSTVNRIKRFLGDFKYQSFQYKIVWSIRIMLWIVVIGIAMLGAVHRLAKYF